MNVSREYKEWLENQFGKDVKFLDNRIVSICSYEKVEPIKVVIPSKMYPLLGDGDVEIFTCYNTKILEDERIRNIYDSTEFKVGNCYSNSYRLLEGLEKAGVEDVSSYVGWFYNCTNDMPVHHCAVVYKGIYMLDMSSDRDIEGLKSIRGSKDEMREKLSKWYTNRLKNLKASERTCFGDMMPHSLFIAKKLKPSKGADFFFNDIIKTYPQHPSYKNIGLNGATKLQNMINDIL